MITREQILELAEFDDPTGCAFSFYFQPAVPRNKAHKEETILAKELAREALRQLESKDNSNCATARVDLDRIVQLSQDLRSNGIHAKAVFACSARGFWREFDLPAQLDATELLVDRHFQLKPLSKSFGALSNVGIVLLDRHRARLFDLRFGELTEREGFFHPLTRRGRGDGFAGYDGGHAERRVADEARHHFKFVADFLKDSLDSGLFENWILGCQEMHWPQFETQLHRYASQKLLGRFPADVAHINRDEIRTQANLILAESRKKRCEEAVRETLSYARSGGRGVTGLRRVLRSLEAGEVQTLLIGQGYHAQAVECSRCGHLDAHLVAFCPLCGRETREVVDVAEAILRWVIRQKIELLYIKGDPEFDKVGNIAALLRFRSEQNSGDNIRSITDVRVNPSVSRRAGLVGRYRGLAGG